MLIKESGMSASKWPVAFSSRESNEAPFSGPSTSHRSKWPIKVWVLDTAMHDVLIDKMSGSLHSSYCKPRPKEEMPRFILLLPCCWDRTSW